MPLWVHKKSRSQMMTTAFFKIKMAINGIRACALNGIQWQKNSSALAIQRPTGAPAIQCHSMSFRLRRSLLTHVTSYIVTGVRAHVTV